MIELQASYAVADSVPFTAEVYFRLLERIGEPLWPLHLLKLATGILMLRLTLLGRVRIVSALLALCWAWVGINFFIRHYAQLNWAGEYIGWAFLLQAGLLGVHAIVGGQSENHRCLLSVSTITGITLTAAALAAYPLIAPLSSQSWNQAETFAIHADPTALASMGMRLLMSRGLSLWVLARIELGLQAEFNPRQYPRSTIAESRQ